MNSKTTLTRFVLKCSFVFFGILLFGSSIFPQKSEEGRRLKMILSPDSLVVQLRSRIDLSCKLINLRNRTFRIWNGLYFGRSDLVFESVILELLLDGKPYDEWKLENINERFDRPKKGDVVVLHKNQVYHFVGDIGYYYSLIGKGTYRLRAIFKPIRMKGVKVSLAPAVYSNWITVIVE